MQATVRTATIRGVTAVPVEVQVDVSSGLPAFGIVGLADAAVLEARERVRSAVRTCGFDFPNRRVTVNLAPAPLRKRGTGFDLPIALAILLATNQIQRDVVDDALVVGELGLDGRVRSVPGVLAYALAARDAGAALVCAPDAAHRAATLLDVTCRPVESLATMRTGLTSYSEASEYVVAPGHGLDPLDMCDVIRQEEAKRALVIAAAGQHNIVLTGPPGSGKTMLARRCAGLMPPLAHAERIETALVHSIAGLDERPVLAGTRPFRAPHHSCSIAGLVGGGSPPRPGEVSLAHNGVLFLDELAEFGPAALQTLRQPMEDGVVRLVRADGRITYPASFMLIGATNPCPCGFSGDEERACTCPADRVARYQGRLGGPLLDRIDMQVSVRRPPADALLSDRRCGEDTEHLRAHVLRARERAEARAGSSDASADAHHVRNIAWLSPAARSQLELSARNLFLSGRAVSRIIQVARTIADLQDADTVSQESVLEAIGLRVVRGGDS